MQLLIYKTEEEYIFKFCSVSQSFTTKLFCLHQHDLDFYNTVQRASLEFINQ